MQTALHFETSVVAVRRAFLACDSTSVILSFWLSYRLLPYYRPYLEPGRYHYGPFSEYAWCLLLILPLWLTLQGRWGLYSRARLSWSFVFLQLFRVQAFGLAGLAVIIFTLKLEAVSRLIVFGFLMLYCPAFIGARWLVSAVFDAHCSHAYNMPRILVIGSRSRARDFIQRTRKSPDIHYQVVGCLEPDPAQAHGELEGVPILGTTSDLRQYVFAHPVDVVAFALPLELVPGAKGLIEAVVDLGLRAVVCPDFYFEQLGCGLNDSRMSIESYCGMPVAVFSTVRQGTVYVALKRVLDVVASTTMLALLSPLLGTIAILIKVSSPDDPVLYPWRVVGLNKKPFIGYKFRTMVANAEKLKSELMAHNEMTGPVFKMSKDPRVTRLGRILRKYSLDELPQLYSVLKGDMSLVGPRPPAEEEADHFEFWQRRKLSVKPGITCLWQVNGRSKITKFEDWARLDLEYIRSASFWLDCKILLETIPAVVRGRGAH